MEEKKAFSIQLDPIKLPTMGEVIDLLKNWYVQQTGPAHLKTIQDTKYVLKLWGRIE